MSNLVLLIFLLLSILQNIGPPSVNVNACSGGRNKNGDDKEKPASTIPPSTSATTSSSSTTPTTLATPPTSPTTTTSSQLFLSKKVRRIVNPKYSESFGPYHNIYSWHMEVDDEAANLKVV